MVYTLVLLRHGQSDWNQKNLFTGWVDVRLSDIGRAEAKRAGELLVEKGVLPDVLHTSVLTRAIQTADIALLNDRIELLGTLFTLARKVRRTIYGNLGFGITLNVAAIALAIGTSNLKARNLKPERTLRSTSENTRRLKESFHEKVQ